MTTTALVTVEKAKYDESELSKGTPNQCWDCWLAASCAPLAPPLQMLLPPPPISLSLQPFSGSSLAIHRHLHFSRNATISQFSRYYLSALRINLRIRKALHKP